MADSIDRVFVKAISTIRTLSTRTGYGSLPRPPLENRIRLYGLYKQATEGNVIGVMQRPVGSSHEDENAKRKWDAWKEEEGISKTEAKRRYISFLIDTMKLYASGTHEARELLGELEYLWDQIKDVEPGMDGSDDAAVGGSQSQLNFMSPAFGNFLSGARSSSVCYSGSALGPEYDSFNESYLNQSLHHGRHHSNTGGIRNELKDVQFLKKEVNLALRRLNDEISTKNDDGDRKKKTSIFGLKIWEFFRLIDNEGKLSWQVLAVRKIIIVVFRILFKLFKKIVVEFIVLLVLINLLKYKNGVELDLRTLEKREGPRKRLGLFQDLVFSLLKRSGLCSLFNFNRIYINVD